MSNIGNVVKAVFLFALAGGCASETAQPRMQQRYGDPDASTRHITSDALTRYITGRRGCGMYDQGDFTFVDTGATPLMMAAAIENGELVPEIEINGDEVKVRVEGMLGGSLGYDLDPFATQADTDGDRIILPEESRHWFRGWIRNYALTHQNKAQSAFNTQNRKNLYNGRARK